MAEHTAVTRVVGVVILVGMGVQAPVHVFPDTTSVRVTGKCSEKALPSDDLRLVQMGSMKLLV